MIRTRLAAVCRLAAVSAVLFGTVAHAQVTRLTGNVGGAGGPFDVLFVNGSNGGTDRTVEVGLNQPITFDMIPAGTVAPGALFAIWGFIGQTGPNDVTTLPAGIGEMAFPPCPLIPGHPQLFALIDPFELGCPAIVTGTPAPWTLTVPGGLSGPLTVALQGVIIDPAGVLGISITNAVILNVVDDTATVIYSKLPGHPTSIVPGATDSLGNPVVTEFRAFEQLVGSPDGSKWMLRGRTQQVGVNETIMMVGGGTTGTVFGQQGLPIPGGAPGEVYDFFGSGLGRFNDNNDFAFSARAMGGNAAIFQKVIRVVNGAGSIAFAMGTPCIGLIDIPANPSGDELFGNSVGSIHLLNNLVIGSHDTTIQNISSTRRPAIFYDTTAFHQTGVTTVLGLDGVTPQTWATLDSNKFYTTPDGLHWATSGRVVGPPTTSDAVFVVDGQVRLQEGTLVPGGFVTPATFLNFNLSGNGHWYVRGALSPSGAYGIRDGVVVAKTGDPIVPSWLPAETWVSGFSAFTGNRNGDWVVFGQSSAGAATNDVIVYNGTTIVAREGDPVDLDGNGLLDDDAFIGRGDNTLSAFSADNAFLTDDGTLYFFISLRNGAGVDLNTVPAFGTPLAFISKRIAHN
jgi:hypothetical protein